IMNLSDSLSGDIVRVVKVVGAGALKQRLLDMGFTLGSEIKVERSAPLFDPIHIKIKGYSLAIRKSEAEKVVVEKVVL
ncbi:MAG: FeoA family protein, partial [Lentisphaeria bacterium]